MLCTDLAFTIPAAENTGKPQLGYLLMKAVRPVIASDDGLPYLQKISVGSHSTSGKDKECEKERTIYEEIMIGFSRIGLNYLYFMQHSTTIFCDCFFANLSN